MVLDDGKTIYIDGVVQDVLYHNVDFGVNNQHVPLSFQVKDKSQRLAFEGSSPPPLQNNMYVKGVALKPSTDYFLPTISALVAYDKRDGNHLWSYTPSSARTE